MPRSRRGLPRRPVEPEPEFDPDEIVWGAPADAELGDDEDDEPGTPPPMPSNGEPATPPSDALLAFGPPPKDALAAEKWAHEILMYQAYECMKSNMPEAQRRKEVRVILRDAKGHMTDASRYDYMQMVEREARQLEAKKRGRAAGKLQPRGTAVPAGAKIIPLRPGNG